MGWVSFWGKTRAWPLTPMLLQLHQCNWGQPLALGLQGTWTSSSAFSTWTVRQILNSWDYCKIHSGESQRVSSWKQFVLHATPLDFLSSNSLITERRVQVQRYFFLVCLLLCQGPNPACIVETALYAASRDFSVVKETQVWMDLLFMISFNLTEQITFQVCNFWHFFYKTLTSDLWKSQVCAHYFPL